jgi:hypothetical protein
MNTLQLAKFKAHLLMELGDKPVTPFLYDIVYDSTKEEPEELDPEDYEDEDEMYQAYQSWGSQPEFEYEFTSPESDTTYTVHLQLKGAESPKLVIDFDADGSYDSTGKGEMFRIMSTIVKIIQEVVEEKLGGIDKIDAIEYSPVRKLQGDIPIPSHDPNNPKKADEPVSKRDMLYRNYIKAAFPGKEITFLNAGNGAIRANLPSNKQLQEKVEGVQWLQKPYFWAAQGHFPLTPNIAKIINGEKGIRVDAFHITSAKNASRLKQLEGSKKSISVMTKVPQYSLEDLSGIHSHGVMFSLEGNVLLKSIDDIMSTPDESGRRWINLSLINERIGKQYRQYMSQDSRLDDLRSRLESDYDKKVGSNWNSVYNDKLVDSSELSLSKEELREFLTLWISRSMTWIKENLEEFIQALSSKKYGQTQYDEVVVNQIELTGAVVNLADLRGTEEQINKMKQEIEDTVGSDNVVYIDSSNFDRTNKQSNRAKVTNFILGNGGKIGNDD